MFAAARCAYLACDSRITDGLAMGQYGKRWSAGDRSIGWWEQMVGLLRFRFAAGVCVLAAGLLMGGGAVAVADPGSNGSAANSTDTNQQPSTGAKKPTTDAK